MTIRQYEKATNEEQLEKSIQGYCKEHEDDCFDAIEEGCPYVIEAFKAGAEWQKEQFEKERLKHCDELTAEQAQIESDFVVQHLKNFNRTPTFIDAIEYGRKAMREKAISRLESLCKEWHLHESTEAKYRLEVYKELIEILKED